MSDIRAEMMRVAVAMKHFTYPFLAQIFEVTTEARGKFLGSGTFLDLGGVPYLLTAAHVPAEARILRWAHSLDDATRPAIVPNPWQCLSFPEDLAVARLDAQHFQGQFRVRTLNSMFLSEDANDLDNDFLFIHGWPGELSKELWSLANGIASKTCPYITVVGKSSRSWFNETVHLAMDFHIDNQTDENGRVTSAPDPHGMSGSVVWRTNWKNHRDTWKPDCARIIGVAHDWDQPGHALTCTRIERIREFLNWSVHREAAYFHWQNRGGPVFDDWKDWFSVQRFLLSHIDL